MLRCYTSRVECGHTVPSIETPEKYARAMEIPMYQLFCERDAAPEKLKLPPDKAAKWGVTASESAELRFYPVAGATE
jgi:transcriptional regulator with XRE-family HTH domain